MVKSWEESLGASPKRNKRFHHAPNNHLGRRHVQRHAGSSGQPERLIAGTPEYEQALQRFQPDR